MSQENGSRKIFLVIVQFHEMFTNVTPVTFSVRQIDYGLCNIPVRTDS